MNMKLTCEIDFNLENQDIDDIVCSALEGGITYWCKRVEVVGKYRGEYASDQISRGGELILYDAESDDKWTLNKAKFINGLLRYVKSDPTIIDFSNHLDCGNIIDVCNVDGSIADEIIQYALFGTIVFG